MLGHSMQDKNSNRGKSDKQYILWQKTNCTKKVYRGKSFAFVFAKSSAV